MIVADPEAAGGERAKILDFGIAKAHGPEDPAGIRTGTGVLMGTPLYMSPEQCRGRGEITSKTDVYSLGIMLFQMVSGRMPLGGGGSGELIAQHLYMDPLPLREADPSASIELEQLLAAMLAKTPEARPDMAEVVKQLERLGAERSQPLPAIVSGAQKAISPSWPVVVEMTPTPATTLGSATGDQGGTAKRSQKLALRLSLFGVAIAALAVIGLGYVRSQKNVPPAPLPTPLATSPQHGPPATKVEPTAAPLTKVHWRLTSVPPGAKVMREGSQEQLGVTPWVIDMPQSDAKLGIVLQLAGYLDQSVELSQREGIDRQEKLHPVANRAGAGRGTAKNKSGAIKSSKKPGSQEVSDDEIRIIK